MWGIEDNDIRHDWTGLKKRIKKYGVRNSLVVALMPTASTSQILGNNVAFEFFNSNIFTRKTLAGDFVVMNKYLVDDLLLLNEWSKEKKDLIVMNNGSVQDIEGIPRMFKYLYKTQFEIKQRWVLDHAVARSPYVCQTQSMNLFFDKPNNKFCYSSDMYAWKNGLKTGCYYLQTKPATNAVKVTIDPRLMRVTNNDEHEVCESCSA
jgi:ribonucleoside-diphosphate reductase alpha chain